MPPDAALSVLSTAASTLFEATPFMIAGVALARFAGRRNATAYLACGCSGGPSARSIPAAIVTCLAFGPAIAIARFFAAVSVACILNRARPVTHSNCAEHSAVDLLSQLRTLVPPALVAGMIAQISAWMDVRHLQPFAQIVAGSLLGFAAPCGVGAVAVGAALHQRAPLAASAFLCAAGIVDARAFIRTDGRRSHPDALAYATLAAALALVGLRRGGTLVHPAFSDSLLACGALTLLSALRNRRMRDLPARLAPALMLAGAIVSAPAPAYRATESTLTDVFSGEPLSFTGTLVRTRDAAALVRYAITCCRADAAPVVVRLARVPPITPGTWLHAEGTLAVKEGQPQLIVSRMDRIAPPADPFTYR